MSLDIQRDVPLAPLTTLGLGGPARYFAVARSEEDIREAQAHARKHGLRLFVLGGGSNTIFLDAGYDGLVLQIALGGISELPTFVPDHAADVSAGPHDGAKSARCSIRVAAGESWDAFVALSVESGLSGIESLSGIPGQAGSVPIQNVGAYGQEVSSTIERVEGIDESGTHVVLSAADCQFGYRSSRFKSGDPLIITAVHFSLHRTGAIEPAYPELRTAFDRAREHAAASAAVAGASVAPSAAPGRREELRLLRECVIEIRRRKSMVYDPADPESHSVGSFFLNPVLARDEYRAFEDRLRATNADLSAPAYASGDCMKLSAAWLVEHAGFPRGYEADGVGVSKAHTLSLVNRGGSTRALLDLARRIQGVVRDRFGIELHREPVVAM